MDPIMLEEIKQLLMIYWGGIKSVQRGRVSGTVGDSGRVQLSATLSPVDVSRSFFIVTSAITNASNVTDRRFTDVTVSEFDGETLSMYVRNIKAASVGSSVQVVADWQVIEFK